MEMEKNIVHTELYWVPYAGARELTPFYCDIKDKAQAEVILNSLIEKKAEILMEQKFKEFAKNKLYRLFIEA